MPDSVSSLTYILDVQDHAIAGMYAIGINDCHSALFNGASRLGGVWVPNNNYQGRVNDEYARGVRKLIFDM